MVACKPCLTYAFWNSSSREYVNFIGRPGCLCANGIKIPSNVVPALDPNPPPTAGDNTLSLLSGISKASDNACLTAYGD